MEIFLDIMILTDYSPKLKKTRQIIAVILVNLEEPFYSEKAHKIVKMWKNVANYFLEQQGWTHFKKKTFPQSKHKYNVVCQWCTAGHCNQNLLQQVSVKTKVKEVVQWVLRCTSLTDHTIMKTCQKIGS